MFRKLLHAITIVSILILCSAVSAAQTFVGGGVKINHTTNTDNTVPGVYGEAGLQLPAGFQARFVFDYSTDAELATLLTRDNNPQRVARDEFRFRPTLRYQTPRIGALRPFVEAGVDIYRQRFDGLGAECYGGNCGQAYGGYSGYSTPKLSTAGLNPLASAGLGFGGYEGSYTRIFPDQGSWNISRLEGHRVGGSYYRHLSGRLGLKVSGEADFVSFHEAYGRYFDYYREEDATFRVRLGFTFGGRKDQ